MTEAITLILWLLGFGWCVRQNRKDRAERRSIVAENLARCRRSFEAYKMVRMGLYETARIKDPMYRR